VKAGRVLSEDAEAYDQDAAAKRVLF